MRNNLLCPYPGRNLPGIQYDKKLFLTINFIDSFFVQNSAIFNYRLSRARRVIENSFGILAARWRFLRRPIIAHPDRVILFTQAAVALHNYLRTVESTVYCPPGFVDSEDACGNIIEGSWRNDEDVTGLQSVSRTGSNRYVLMNKFSLMVSCTSLIYRYSRTAAQTRQHFTDYFCSATGEVDWQYQYVRRTN